MNILNSKKRRAISPVLSVLLMIVVAVAGALVTYAWSMGYLDFTTAKAGRAMQIQSTALDESRQVLTIYLQNVGQGPINLDPTGEDIVYINGGLVPIGALDDSVLDEGETIPLTVNLGDPLPYNEDVKVKVAGLQGTTMQATVIPELYGAGAPGATITPPPTVTRELSSEAGFSGVEAGDLLVVIVNTRTGTYTTGALTATAATYDTVQVASFFQTTGDRRAVALLAKTADGTESGTVSVTWGGTGVSSYETLYQVYRGDGDDIWTAIANGANHGTEPEVNTLTVPSAALPGGTDENVLSIGAMVWRDDPGTPAFTNLAGLTEFDFNGAFSATEFNYGLPVETTVVTWPTVQRASGLLVQFECE
jgi:FlaG/FlaF family flagellin (archaellin)